MQYTGLDVLHRFLTLRYSGSSPRFIHDSFATACSGGEARVNILKALLNTGEIDVNRTWFNKTPLIIAIEKMNLWAVKAVADAGANVNGSWGSSRFFDPLDYAMECGTAEIVSYLETKGAVKRGTPGWKALYQQDEMPPTKRSRLE
ncbi:hypothetical protein CC80DRAFT_546453 [Byssothecium circinans]|uniref:Uncharacterized protein n=1 Tax=Byssothecium circinans TaxID=147558 RepID=A0A6A5U021_9PLEO|nr:hypothetical protein CC80DRAFT_546453 [Byssothecium circinans]